MDSLLVTRNQTTKFKKCMKLLCRLYWKTIVIIAIPMLLLPIAYIGDNEAYKSYFGLLVIALYWIVDILHPCLISLVPIALSTFIGTFNNGFVKKITVCNDVVNCVAVSFIIVAIEHSNIQKRIALKILLFTGCSHYRLSFILFFSSMFLSMWIPNVLACGLIMPLVKAILTELETMGILEMYITEVKFNEHIISSRRPSDYTVFYFIGIAYSTTIGGMATLSGNQPNQVFKLYSETIFPNSPDVMYPQFLLLNLPGVLITEALLYIWMNFYFLGMFRAQSEIALEIGMTEEEAAYINVLLLRQYQEISSMKSKEIIVSSLVLMMVLFEAFSGLFYIEFIYIKDLHHHIRLFSPSIICVLLLCIIPTNLDFVKFFQRSQEDPLPKSQSPTCLTWELIKNNVNWNILLITGGSCIIFEAMKDSMMTNEFDKFLLNIKEWPSTTVVFVVMAFCKIHTEFGCNSSVVYFLLPSIAKLSVAAKLHPRRLMLAGTLAGSLPFHLLPGSAAYVLPYAYAGIPTRKILSAGVGPSIIAFLVAWFTVEVWSKAIWTDLADYPKWADEYDFNITLT